MILDLQWLEHNLGNEEVLKSPRYPALVGMINKLQPTLSKVPSASPGLNTEGILCLLNDQLLEHVLGLCLCPSDMTVMSVIRHVSRDMFKGVENLCASYCREHNWPLQSCYGLICTKDKILRAWFHIQEPNDNDNAPVETSEMIVNRLIGVHGQWDAFTESAYALEKQYDYTRVIWCMAAFIFAMTRQDKAFIVDSNSVKLAMLEMLERAKTLHCLHHLVWLYEGLLLGGAQPLQHIVVSTLRSLAYESPDLLTDGVVFGLLNSIVRLIPMSEALLHANSEERYNIFFVLRAAFETGKFWELAQKGMAQLIRLLSHFLPITHYLCTGLPTSATMSNMNDWFEEFCVHPKIFPHTAFWHLVTVFARGPAEHVPLDLKKQILGLLVGAMRQRFGMCQTFNFYRNANGYLTCCWVEICRDERCLSMFLEYIRIYHCSDLIYQLLHETFQELADATYLKTHGNSHLIGGNRLPFLHTFYGVMLALSRDQGLAHLNGQLSVLLRQISGGIGRCSAGQEHALRNEYMEFIGKMIAVCNNPCKDHAYKVELVAKKRKY